MGIDDIKIDWECTALQVSCPSQVNVDLSGCNGQMPDLTSYVTFTSKCDTIYSTTQSIAAGTVYTRGSTSVNVTSYDNAGNNATCKITVNVGVTINCY
jgi:hypothetical protein